MTRHQAGRHEYATRIVWTGNTGPGTSGYAGYGRAYRVRIAGKPDLAGSADPAFRGDAARHNPEDLFVSAIAACHMLTYLALCARRGVCVLAYEDAAVGTVLTLPQGGGRFEEVRLSPTVTVADAGQARLAGELHEEAHRQCFIAGSCSIPIRCRPAVRAGERGSLSTENER